MSSPLPQHCPSPRELDDLELLLSGAVPGEPALGRPGSAFTLALPDDLAAAADARAGRPGGSAAGPRHPSRRRRLGARRADPAPVRPVPTALPHPRRDPRALRRPHRRPRHGSRHRRPARPARRPRPRAAARLRRPRHPRPLPRGAAPRDAAGGGVAARRRRGGRAARHPRRPRPRPRARRHRSRRPTPATTRSWGWPTAARCCPSSTTSSTPTSRRPTRSGSCCSSPASRAAASPRSPAPSSTGCSSRAAARSRASTATSCAAISRPVSRSPASDRETNIRRIGWVAAEIARHGGVWPSCSPIAPFDETRQQVRAMVDEAGGAFFLVHVATPLEECERRDRKGLYAKARRGEIPEFTGISSPYEEPDDADVRVDTTGRSIDDALADVLDRPRATAGYLDLATSPDPSSRRVALPPVVEPGERQRARVETPGRRRHPVVEPGERQRARVETPGPRPRRPHRTPHPLNVLFVCTANICRSPYMELTARHLAGDAAVTFASAGTHGFDDRADGPADGRRRSPSATSTPTGVPQPTAHAGPGARGRPRHHRRDRAPQLHPRRRPERLPQGLHARPAGARRCSRLEPGLAAARPAPRARRAARHRLGRPRRRRPLPPRSRRGRGVRPAHRHAPADVVPRLVASVRMPPVGEPT